MSRALRFKTPIEQAQEEVVEQAVVLDAVSSKVDRYASAQNKFKSLETKFKAESKPYKTEMENILPELREVAKERDTITLMGDKSMLVFGGRTESAVDPIKLFQFFQSEQNVRRFFDFIKVQVTELKDAFGEEALIAAGLLVKETNKFHSAKCTAKT